MSQPTRIFEVQNQILKASSLEPVGMSQASLRSPLREDSARKLRLLHIGSMHKSGYNDYKQKSEQLEDELYQ